MRSSSIYKKLRSSSIFKKFEVVFHLQRIEVFFHISSSWVNIRLHTENQLPRLPGKNLWSFYIWIKLSLSSISKNIDVVFHISSSWVNIRLHIKNQLPMLSQSALKVWLVVGGGVVQLITLSTPTRVEVELGWGCGWAVTKIF